MASILVTALTGALTVFVTAAAPPSQAAPVTLLNHTFEGGATHGWTGASTTTANQVVGATAHGGTSVLSISAKTADWGFGGRDLSTTLQAGTTYTLSAYVRKAAGAGKATMTVNAGAAYLNDGTYEVDISDAGWTLFTRTYTPAAGQPLPNPLQVMISPLADYEIYVDDFTLTYVEPGVTITDLNHTFESGATHGWTGASTTTANQVVGATAHGGTSVLSISAKTADWGFGGRDLSTTLQAGTTYTLSAYVRKAAGAGKATMTVNAGAAYLNDGTYEVDISDAGWTLFTRTYTPAAGQPLPNPLQVMISPLADYEIYVDDFTLTHEGPADPPPVNTVVTDTFEDGSVENWTPTSTASVTNSTDQAHGGTHSLSTTGRTANWHAPSLNLLGKTHTGTQYTFSVWVRMAAGTDDLKMTMKSRAGAEVGDSYTTVGELTTITNGGWTQLTGTWTAPANAITLVLYVEGASATSAYFLDDFTMTYTGDEVQPDAPALPAGLVKIADFGNNPGNLNMYLHVPDQLANPAPVVVASHNCTGTGPGFYSGYMSEFVQASDQYGFIMIFPESTRDGRCFDSATPGALAVPGTSDPASIRSMVSYVAANYVEDPTKIFATGVSSGAMMTNTLLGNYPDVFAAGASFMGVAHSCFATGNASMWNSSCAEGTLSRTPQEWGDLVRAVNPAYQGAYPRMQLWHDLDDTIINYNNLGEATEEWTNLHGLTTTPANTSSILGNASRKRYGATTVAPPVETISTNGYGHDLPKPGMTAHALAFFGLAPEVPDENAGLPDGYVLQHGFEDGTTQGWASRGNVETVTNSITVAHGGTHSLRTAGRAESWQAPILNMLGRLQFGRTYEITAWMRTVSGQGPANGRLTMERRLNGTPTYQGVSQSTAITEHDWTRVTGTYTFNAEADFLKLYAETNGLQDFYIDDVSVRIAPMNPPQDPVDDPTQCDAGRDDGEGTLLSHDFEDGTTQCWESRGGVESVVNTSKIAHGGTHSIAVTGRLQNWQGPIVNLLDRAKPGVAYTVSAWMRAKEGVGTAKARLTVERRLNEVPNYEGLTLETTITDTEWTKLSGTYTLAHEVDFLKLYAETLQTEDFYLDDVKITYTPTKPIQMDIPSLKDEFEKFWPRSGAAVGLPQIQGDRATLLKKHFNSITGENAMKWDSLQRRQGTWTWTDADALVDFAQKNDIGVYGHTLLWHWQLPDWVFQDANGNDLPVNEDSKKLVLSRLENHVRTVVGRYKGKVYAWDVANEVISDNEGEDYRQSKWYQYTGLDFIRTGFRVAHEADPAAQLCINDYNGTETPKREKYFNLVKLLKDEGVQIDCVGHQVHATLDYPTAQDMDETLGYFAKLGIPQRITEMDISTYFKGEEYFDPIPEVNVKAQEAQYKALFEVFLKHAKAIDSVTFWGLADDRTWLAEKRPNTPLLFDKQLQAKPAFHTVVDLAKGWQVEEDGKEAITQKVVLKARGTAYANVRLYGGWCLKPNTPAYIVANSTRVSGAAGTITTTLTKTDDGYRARIPLVPTSERGVYKVYLKGENCTGTTYQDGAEASLLGSFRAMVPTSVSVNASPEPIRKGGTLTVKGVFTRLAAGRMQGASGVTVRVEFQPLRSKTSTLVKTLRTGKGGAFTTKVRAQRDGTWRVRFPGNINYTMSSKGDFVDVR